jgi:hypothetical protein
MQLFTSVFLFFKFFAESEEKELEKRIMWKTAKDQKVSTSTDMKRRKKFSILKKKKFML